MNSEYSIQLNWAPGRHDSAARWVVSHVMRHKIFILTLLAGAIGNAAGGALMSVYIGQAFNASVNHDLSFYDEFQTGKIVSRITSDTQEFAQMVALVTDLFSQVLTVLILLPILARIEWRLSLALLSMSPVVYGVAVSFRTIARRVTRQGFRAMARSTRRCRKR